MKYVASLTALALASAAVLAIAAPEGGPRQHGGAVERIKQADTDGNGFLSRDEAKALPMISKHFDEIDTNKDNQLSPDELKAFHEKMRAEHGQKRGERMAEHFKKLDTDGDGKVSLAEAKANAPRLAEHFAEIDTNGDGFITLEEMKAAHERHGKRQK